MPPLAAQPLSPGVPHALAITAMIISKLKTVNCRFIFFLLHEFYFVTQGSVSVLGERNTKSRLNFL